MWGKKSKQEQNKEQPHLSKKSASTEPRLSNILLSLLYPGRGHLSSEVSKSSIIGLGIGVYVSRLSLPPVFFLRFSTFRLLVNASFLLRTIWDGSLLPAHCPITFRGGAHTKKRKLLSMLSAADFWDLPNYRHPVFLIRSQAINSQLNSNRQSDRFSFDRSCAYHFNIT